jgi:hypothetical protein
MTWQTAAVIISLVITAPFWFYVALQANHRSRKAAEHARVNDRAMRLELRKFQAWKDAHAPRREKKLVPVDNVVKGTFHRPAKKPPEENN